MSYIEQIFARAKVGNVVDGILYGPQPVSTSEDYEKRMEKAFKEYEKIISKIDFGDNSELYDAANALTEVISAVYMEIGFQAGILFMQEINYNSVKYKDGII